MSATGAAAVAEDETNYNYRRRDSLHGLEADDAIDKPPHTDTKLNRRTAAIGRRE